jgi:hypothetical protein
MYTFLVGAPGTRKGTALNPIKNILEKVGYRKIAPQRVSPEMFLAYMSKTHIQGVEWMNDIELEELDIDAGHECFVLADEIADFIRGNTDFVKVLTNLWDNLPQYEHPKLHGNSIRLNRPTINITGGITPEDIMLSIPPEAVGQGFFSRVILVFGESTGRRITIPKSPDKDIVEEFAKQVAFIRDNIKGVATTDASGYGALDHIYNKYKGIDNPVFRHYNSRRFTHLLKLSMVMAALDRTIIISEAHVRKAHTILYVTEQRMPKALGEFGRSRNSGVANNIIEILRTNGMPLTVKQIWAHVHNDLNKFQDMVDIISGLQMADKVQQMKFKVKGEVCTGFVCKNVANGREDGKDMLWTEEGFLSPEEMA